jgi:signal transduction histidine kinase
MLSRRPLSLDPLDYALATTVAILFATFLVTLLPTVVVRVFAPGLDLVFDTITTLVTLAVAGLAWVRFRDQGQSAALFQAAAFSLLAVARAMAALLALWYFDFTTATSPLSFEADVLDVSTLACLTCGALLVAGGLISASGRGQGRPGVVVALPVVLLVAVVATTPVWVSLVPPLVDHPVRVTPGSAASLLPGPTVANVLLQGIGAALFGWAAAMYLRGRNRGRSVADRYLAVGLCVAAFAQLHLALYPSAYPGVLTSGDLLYLVFDLILLLGIVAEMRAYVTNLRRANLSLGRMKDAEVDRAAIEERTRLSRELHDGLAQDLWLAKLKIGRLAALPDLGPEAEQLCAELGNVIDSGLADARQAVMALRVVAEPHQSFGELLGRYVDDFADRFGIRAEFECEPGLPRLATRVEAELLRIAQEALRNVRRHADATVVRVHVGIDDGRVKVTVLDNGRGFDPATVDGAGYGLTGMRERASLIGGRLSIASRPSDGTTVTIDVAVPAGVDGVMA